MSICQLQKIKRKHFILNILLLSLLLGVLSCASFISKFKSPTNSGLGSKIVVRPSEWPIRASWFRVPERFEGLGPKDLPITHPFFDGEADLQKNSFYIRYFVTTFFESAHRYNIDLVSGQIYKERDYCPVNDVWRSYQNELHRPHFIEGIVPKVYDENLNPQRLIVFSPESTNSSAKITEVKFKQRPTNYYRAKIVGSVLLESCESFPCDLKAKWKKSQILIAVNSYDSEFSRINSLSQLKKEIDWDYDKALLANQEGVFQTSNKTVPAFRVTKEYDRAETMKYYWANSVPVKMPELLKWREGCFSLYDSIWADTLKTRSLKKEQGLAFLIWFKNFHKEGSERFYACQKLIRPSAINEDPKRFWFFTYLQIFTKLSKNGFYYNCREKSWNYNVKIDDSHFAFDRDEELKKCRPQDFERSFDQSVNALVLMNNQLNKSFRFVEYDSQLGGSHQKLYSWIEDSGKISACKNKNLALRKTQLDFFPQDISWESFLKQEEFNIH